MPSTDAESRRQSGRDRVVAFCHSGRSPQHRSLRHLACSSARLHWMDYRRMNAEPGRQFHNRVLAHQHFNRHPGP